MGCDLIMNINYTKRMLEYYPNVIQAILEFQAIIDSESPEIEALSKGVERVTTDAYLTTMSEERLAQWEQLLSIKPRSDSTISNRRDTVIARIRAQSKLNTETIDLIVKTFTGGTAKSFVKNGTLYVRITPPPENKQYQFKDVEQEIKRKVPAHLKCVVERNYYTWENVNNDYSTWEVLLANQGIWSNVLLSIAD
jgi:hypothetical protein